MHSARLRQIVSDMTSRSEERLKPLEDALESDHSSVSCLSLDRHENTTVLDRATPLVKLTQSKPEGTFSVRMRLGTICFQLMEDIFS